MLTGKQTKGGSLTPSHEHYVRAIAEVRSRLGYARLVERLASLGARVRLESEPSS